MKVIELIELPEYKAFLAELNEVLPRKIDYTYRLRPIIFDILERLLSFADATGKDLLYIIENHKQAAIRYLVDKYIEMSKEPLEEGVVEVLPPNITFPIADLIQFFIFEQKRDIHDYVKKLRMPGARKFIRQITEIYQQAIVNGS